MADNQNNNPAIIRQILKRSLLVEGANNASCRFTLFCRSTEHLGRMVQWLAEKYPEYFPTADSILRDLQALHGETNLDVIRASDELYPIYERLQSKLDIMKVTLPEREGRTSASRRATGCAPCPQEDIYLFGIPLPEPRNDEMAIYNRLKQFRLASCNEARIGAYDPAEKIIVDRLLAQDNLREKC